MNYGPLIFLAAFFALASSWCGFVLAPQLQIGRLQQTNTLGGAAATYPAARPGLAQQGLDVYRAQGCAYCHSQQVGQTGTVLEIALTDAGTNRSALIQELVKLTATSTESPGFLTALPGWEATGSNAATAALLSGLPRALLRSSNREAANAAVAALKATGAKAQLWIVPVGPDIARGWGRRHSVAEDYLFDSPVMPGSQRVGPDLANVGARLPDVRWHLLHLYAPQLQVKGSTMPPFRYLFEERRIESHPSPDTLVLPTDLAPAPGYEVIPKPAAKALAAYLASLRADAPLFNAPMTLPSGTAAPAATNSPAAAGLAPSNAAPASATR